MIWILCGATGCGSRKYPVRGTVKFEDGTPVAEGMVIFENKEGTPLTARGQIGPDGRFELATHARGDGVPPGLYRALVAPKVDPNAVDNPPASPPFDLSIAEFATSGLEFEVKPGRNEFAIQVRLAPTAQSR
jgi:hypothetical protein